MCTQHQPPLTDVCSVQLYTDRVQHCLHQLLQYFTVQQWQQLLERWTLKNGAREVLCRPISPNNTHHYRLLHVTQLPITLAQICFPVLGPDNDTADTVRALRMLTLCSTCAEESGFEDLIYATSCDFRHSLIFQPRLNHLQKPFFLILRVVVKIILKGSYSSYYELTLIIRILINTF